MDDFTLIYPAFDTNMTISIPTNKIEKTGTFYDIAFNQDNMKLDYFNRSPYGAYGWSDKDYIKYRNESAPISLKILSNGDSYGNATFTYLPLVFNTCDELDMRHYKGDFAKYYAEYQPDIFISLLSTGSENAQYVYFK